MFNRWTKLTLWKKSNRLATMAKSEENLMTTKCVGYLSVKWQPKHVLRLGDGGRNGSLLDLPQIGFQGTVFLFKAAKLISAWVKPMPLTPFLSMFIKFCRTNKEPALYWPAICQWVFSLSSCLSTGRGAKGRVSRQEAQAMGWQWYKIRTRNSGE